MTRLLGLPVVAAVLCITAACSLWPAQPPAPQVHDFGLMPVAQDNAAIPVRLDSINAPVWLGTDAIHYRLLYYDDPTAFRSYADHRWAAPPAELLAARLQNLFSIGSMDKTGTRGSYLLSVSLLEFEQDFTTARDAHVQLELDVSMRRASDGQLVAQKRFMMSQPTTPNVQGAVSGLAQLADRTAADIADWAQTQVRKQVR